ncbi:MAG: tRNA 2-thiouridine(34) synthase MnmA [Bacteroidetes bacterium]|jgi:tRNA-uridine 2-sulfurtransferase|nr:tRNA 2-thiouridine(34) synthase MnmA [Bacteroidota bacterium]MBT6687508.1 tRNA 2-thiouridine(34) synthase MnmA [Bacteroidota bacterium]MBT7142996.1 tRNA 2-thiouridine(34) synthase MnmA [Bacteroidota bacterium]MBT7491686.1 tRNA 2-thiouridine(34) synthase MnmA [Bacteroidota bacterium]
MKKKPRVLVAMSGGIDSAITAMMLHKQNYDIVGITLKTWDYTSSGGSKKETGCCSLDSINDARNLAVSLGFPHYIFDVRNEFGNLIIENFVDEYLAGRTPNPCVLCNTYIKWDALLKKADKLSCDYIATGHYAKVKNESGRYFISKGKDNNKDQSYVLWGLTQENLKRTILPLGDFEKEEIRQIAIENGFKELATKSESFEICFVPDNDYRGFLKRKVEGLEKRVGQGNFVLTDGKFLGKHYGYPFYTIGQRKGLNIAVGHPLYVVKIISESNTIELGTKDELNSKEMWVSKLNFMKFDEFPNEFEVKTKIRHRSKETLSRISRVGDRLKVEFYEDVSAITPGQSAVFYDGNDVIGGGIISN